MYTVQVSMVRPCFPRGAPHKAQIISKPGQTSYELHLTTRSKKGSAQIHLHLHTNITVIMGKMTQQNWNQLYHTQASIHQLTEFQEAKVILHFYIHDFEHFNHNILSFMLLCPPPPPQVSQIQKIFRVKLKCSHQKLCQYIYTVFPYSSHIIWLFCKQSLIITSCSLHFIQKINKK